MSARPRTNRDKADKAIKKWLSKSVRGWAKFLRHGRKTRRMLGIFNH